MWASIVKSVKPRLVERLSLRWTMVRWIQRHVSFSVKSPSLIKLLFLWSISTVWRFTTDRTRSIMHEANILDSSASKCLLQWTPNYKNYWASVNSLRLIGCYKSLMFMQLHPRKNTREQARNIITMTITDWCPFDNENSIEDWCEWAGVSECGCALEWMWVCACVTEPPREWVSLCVCVHDSVCVGGRGCCGWGGGMQLLHFFSLHCVQQNRKY